MSKIKNSKKVLKDNRLSLKAIGIMAHLENLPNIKAFTMEGLTEMHTDGKASVRTGIAELIEHGYLKKTRKRDNGKYIGWEYEINMKKSI